MGTLTINTTAGEDSRIATAFGAYLGLPGNANAAQVKAEVVAFIKTVVRDQEKIAAEKAAIIAADAGLPSPITPS